MLYLDGISISKIICEIKDSIEGKKVGKVFQNSSLSLSLHFGKQSLFFSCNPSLPICYINSEKEDKILEETSNFLMVLRKHLLNSSLKSVKQLGYDRILKFTFSKINEVGEIKNNFLYFEIMGKHSNVILTDENNIIMGLLKKFSLEENSLRTLFNGATYVQPIVIKKENPKFVSEDSFKKYLEEGKILENIDGVGKRLVPFIKSYEDLEKILNDSITSKIYFKEELPILATVLNIEPKDYDKVKEYNSFNEMVNEYIKIKSLSNSYVLLKNKLLAVVDKEIKKSDKIIKNIKKDIEVMSEYEKYKNLGDVLASVLYSIKKGDKKVKAYDFYENKEIEITLDPLLTPQSNLTKIYKKGSKMKRGLEVSERRLEEFRNRKNYLESIIFFIDKTKESDDLKNIESELVDEKLIKINSKNKNKKKIKETSYATVEVMGKIIYFGRNNKENDFLTFKFARKDDMWFHIKDIPGSHFIVKKEDFINDDNFISEVAKLAAYYSKGNSGEKVNVDYTEKKNLNKPKGAPLAFVTYNVFKSIIVTVPKNLEDK